MEFNDSSVTDFNFDKLKENCFGGDGKGGDSDYSFGFGGSSYGKSAYMLYYERKIKKPIKILVDKDAEGAIKDETKEDEYYQLLDLKEAEDKIEPNPIY